MDQYLIALLYVSIGLVAGGIHWAKKRYWDKTTRKSLANYMSNEREATYNYVKALIISEVGLALADPGNGLSLAEFVAAFGAGYMSDSVLNKGLDAKQIKTYDSKDSV